MKWIDKMFRFQSNKENKKLHTRMSAIFNWYLKIICSCTFQIKEIQFPFKHHLLNQYVIWADLIWLKLLPIILNDVFIFNKTRYTVALYCTLIII